MKYKIEEKFKLIRYAYSLLFSKIYNRTSQFEIQNKKTFKNKIHRKQNGPIAAKILNQLSQNQANQITTAVLSQAKDPKDYKGQKVNKMNKHQFILKFQQWFKLNLMIILVKKQPKNKKFWKDN